MGTRQRQNLEFQDVLEGTDIICQRMRRRGPILSLPNLVTHVTAPIDQRQRSQNSKPNNPAQFKQTGPSSEIDI
jgi:hypothetical protein